jgi:hypothetical protein
LLNCTWDVFDGSEKQEQAKFNASFFYLGMIEVLRVSNSDRVKFVSFRRICERNKIALICTGDANITSKGADMVVSNGDALKRAV